MKKIIISASFVILLVTTSGIHAARVHVNGNVSIYFSPEGGATRTIVKQINNAQKEVYVQAYVMTSKPIARALVSAFKREVRVIIILDKSELRDKWSMKNVFLKNHIPVYIEYKYRIFHDKIIIIDDKKVITGSFNFTYSAEYHNAENLIIIPSKALAKIYLKNFYVHLRESEKLNEN